MDHGNSRKPPLSKIGLNKIRIAAYLDDCLNINKRERKCWESAKTIVNAFQNLGFTVYPESKSSFYPTQQIEFLRFEINSVSITITLTNAKTENLSVFFTKILQQKANSRTPNLRTVTSLFGKITSTFPAAKRDRLHYRGLKRCKTLALYKSSGPSNARVHLTEAIKSDIRWQKENVNHLCNEIIVTNPDKCITADDASYGWGAVMESNSTGSLFTTSKMKEHIMSQS